MKKNQLLLLLFLLFGHSCGFLVAANSCEELGQVIDREGLRLVERDIDEVVFHGDEEVGRVCESSEPVGRAGVHHLVEVP